MKSDVFLKGLLIAIVASVILAKTAFSTASHDQLPYLYFFSAITLSLFYRARIYK